MHTRTICRQHTTMQQQVVLHGQHGTLTGPWHRRGLMTHALSQPRWQHLSPAAAAPATEAGSASSHADDGSGASSTGRISEYVRPEKQTYARPSIVSTGSLRPSAEWFPAWMKYRRREENYVFWQDKFSRNSMDISYEEKRWTLFSTVWFLVMQLRFYAVPPALRFLVYTAWRAGMMAVYEAHKQLVLLQCKLDVYLAAKGQGLNPPNPTLPFLQPKQPDAGVNAAGESSEASSDSQAQDTPQQDLPRFSREMALRRLHWQNTLLAEVLYLINLYKTGRVHMLPPKKRPLQRPTFFWLF